MDDEKSSFNLDKLLDLQEVFFEIDPKMSVSRIIVSVRLLRSVEPLTLSDLEKDIKLSKSTLSSIIKQIATFRGNRDSKSLFYYGEHIERRRMPIYTTKLGDQLGRVLEEILKD